MRPVRQVSPSPTGCTGWERAGVRVSAPSEITTPSHLAQCFGEVGALPIYPRVLLRKNIPNLTGPRAIRGAGRSHAGRATERLSQLQEGRAPWKPSAWQVSVLLGDRPLALFLRKGCKKAVQPTISMAAGGSGD